MLFLLCLSAFAQGQQNYVVGFYNVENLFDIYDDPLKNDDDYLPDGSYHWTQDKYEKKISNIASVLEAIKEETGEYHSLLGLSEVENMLVLGNLAQSPAIAQTGYRIVHYESPDARGIDVALLYRPDHFEYAASECIPYTFEGSEVEISLDSAARAVFRTRDILMVRGNLAGEDVAVYVCHLPSRVGGKGNDLRSRGAEIIYNHASALARQYPGIKVIVMGDMNDNPYDESMTLWLHGKADVAEVGEGDFFCPFNRLLADGYGSLSYRGEWNIYDIILVGDSLVNAPEGSLRIQKVAGTDYYGQVFKRDFMEQQSGRYAGTPFRTFSHGEFIGGYSDHYPTYIVLGKQQ